MAISDDAATAAVDLPSMGRVRAARIMMGVAAASAAVAVVSAVGTVAGAGEATRMVETWRLFGFAVFTGLFVLLALRPRDYRGIWELAILNKLGLTVTAFVYLLAGSTPGSTTVLIADGTLTLLLVAAYICCKAWQSGPPLRPGPSSELGAGPAGSADTRT